MSIAAIGMRRIIRRKRMVQREVAARAGFSAQQLTDMLHDRKIIRADDLIALAKALGVEIQEIFEEGKNSRRPSGGPDRRLWAAYFGRRFESVEPARDFVVLLVFDFFNAFEALDEQKMPRRRGNTNRGGA